MNSPVAYVIDDDDAVRDSVVLLLQTESIEARGYGGASAFLEEFDLEMSGCVLLDIRMPGMNGIELQLALISRGSVLPVICMTAYGDVPTTVDVMKNGAIDVLTKPVSASMLIEKVKSAFGVCAERKAERAAVAGARQRMALLTAREVEILALIVNDMSSKESARRLGISFRTVEVHRTHIMQKMGADSLLTLSAMAEACGVQTGRVLTPRVTVAPRGPAAPQKL